MMISNSLPEIGDIVWWFESSKWPAQKVYGPATVLKLDFNYSILLLPDGKPREVNHERIFKSRKEAVSFAKKIEEQSTTIHQLLSSTPAFRRSAF